MSKTTWLIGLILLGVMFYLVPVLAIVFVLIGVRSYLVYGKLLGAKRWWIPPVIAATFYALMFLVSFILRTF